MQQGPKMDRVLQPASAPSQPPNVSSASHAEPFPPERPLDESPQGIPLLPPLPPTPPNHYAAQQPGLSSGAGAPPPPVAPSYPYAVTAMPGELLPAHLGSRFFAFLIDMIIYIVIIEIIQSIFGSFLFSGIDLEKLGEMEMTEKQCEDFFSQFLGGGILLLIFSIGAAIFYFCLPMMIWKRSIGHAVFGLIIVSDDDAPISPGTALIRGIVKGLSTWSIYPAMICCCMGLVNFLFIIRRDRRLLHDLISGTKVVRSRQ